MEVAMSEAAAQTLRFGDIVVVVTRKDVKHVHLSVHPPHGATPPTK